MRLLLGQGESYAVSTERVLFLGERSESCSGSIPLKMESWEKTILVLDIQVTF